MNQEQALKALERGKKITHKSFISSEYMKQGGKWEIEFEDGAKCSYEEFFLYRTNKAWQENWSIFGNKSTTPYGSITIESKNKTAMMKCPSCDGLHFNIIGSGLAQCANVQVAEKIGEDYVKADIGCGWSGNFLTDKES